MKAYFSDSEFLDSWWNWGWKDQIGGIITLLAEFSF